MQSMARMFRRFPCLQDVDLRFNDITTEGLRLFADHAKRELDADPPIDRSQLKALRLTNNPLTVDASKVLLDLLKTFSQLQTIQSNVEWEKTSEAHKSNT
jgi:thiamine pyrophosphate-dependent acetolactate synthase large subunit-like protein